ncbi:cell division protein FtsA [Williamsoniiplasma somnilux]|uniref:Cell division protein FtsA n=1 Tax=Williamsoniiplasma somnilux TaxID=215578 RepID=A0A2K8NXU2_9MOLU|nr:hypothetical protein [Williamsoniiplasma somnilux]ATZ18655.1 cell division protein FtsA [Williamsoniiplasma somnilux]
MQILDKRIYATWEVQNNSYNFSVIKYNDKNDILVLYKESYNSKKDLLDAEGKIIDIKAAAKYLNDFCEKYEQSYNGYKLSKISIILPSKNLKICNKYEEILIESDVNIPGQVKREQILNLLSLTKQKAVNNDYKIINSKSINWFLDGNLTNIEGILKLKGHKIGLDSKTYEIDKTVYNTHIQVVKMIGKEILSFYLNIEALYRNIDQDLKKKRSMMIVNWGENSIEAAYFANGALLDYKYIPQGLASVRVIIAKILKIKENIANKYLYNLVDFNSTNIIDSNILYKWDSDTKSLKKNTKENLKLIIQKQISEIYNNAKSLQNNKKDQNLIIYNFGEIRKIPGGEALLKKNILDNEFVYSETIMGIRNSINMEALIGSTRIMDNRNVEKQNRMITSVYTENHKTINERLKNQTFINKENYNKDNSENPKLKPLFLLNEGIIIDKKETN